MHDYLNQLKQFMHSDTSLFLILGEVGSGKTNLLHKMTHQPAALCSIVRLKGKNHLKPQTLLSDLSKQWKVALSDHQAPVKDQLVQLMHGLIRMNHHSVLFIDDAHLLPFSLLTALIQVAVEQEKVGCHLHVVLAGRPSLGDKVSMLDTREIPKIRLGIITQQQARERIEKFLEHTQIRAEVAVIDSIVKRLYEQSEGVPEKMEKLLRNLTVKDFIQPRHAIKKTFSGNSYKFLMGEQGARAIAVLGLVITIVGLFWYEHHPTPLGGPLPLEPYQYEMTKNASKFYTVQLLGSFNKQDISNYVTSHQLGTHAQTYNITYRDKPWYILGMGRYNDYEQAENTLKNLPENLQKQGAWIRPLQN